MPRLVPASWMPDCHMDRVVTHWTGGGYRATALDRKHYHVLIEGDGRLIRGVHSIADNVSTNDGDYAGHTRGLNSRSIGVSVCCMLDAVEPGASRPLKPGSAPMTQKQYEVMAKVVADLCDHYDIPVKPATVLGHGEVQQILGIKQRQKWDPMVLPWDQNRPRGEVGNAFREQVKALLAGPVEVDPEADRIQPVSIQINGVLLTDQGLLREGSSWCPLRLLATRQGWLIRSINASAAIVATPGGDREVKALIRDGRGYVQVADLAAKLGWSTQWDPTTRTVRLTT